MSQRKTTVDDNNAMRYYSGSMTASFADESTQALFRRERVKRPDPRIQRVGLRKLIMMDAAESLETLRSPPGNRLEALSGQLARKHSICINDQWRIVFAWRDGHFHDVEIVDYHCYARLARHS